MYSNVYFQKEEEVSVYSLEYNQKYDFNPMDIIVCLVECSHSSIGQIICVTDTGKVITNTWFKVIYSIVNWCDFQ